MQTDYKIKQITVNSDCCIDFINEEKLTTFRTFKLAEECVFLFGNDLIVHQKDGVLQVIAKIDSKFQKIWGEA